MRVNNNSNFIFFRRSHKWHSTCSEFGFVEFFSSIKRLSSYNNRFCFSSFLTNLLHFRYIYNHQSKSSAQYFIWLSKCVCHLSRTIAEYTITHILVDKNWRFKPMLRSSFIISSYAHLKQNGLQFLETLATQFTHLRVRDNATIKSGKNNQKQTYFQVGPCYYN